MQQVAPNSIVPDSRGLAATRNEWTLRASFVRGGRCNTRSSRSRGSVEFLLMEERMQRITRIVVGACFCCATLFAATSFAASHREAPLIANDPAAAPWVPSNGAAPALSVH